jgi:hypothetical protein
MFPRGACRGVHSRYKTAEVIVLAPNALYEFLGAECTYVNSTAIDAGSPGAGLRGDRASPTNVVQVIHQIFEVVVVTGGIVTALGPGIISLAELPRQVGPKRCTIEARRVNGHMVRVQGVDLVIYALL